MFCTLDECLYNNFSIKIVCAFYDKNVKKGITFFAMLCSTTEDRRRTVAELGTRIETRHRATPRIGTWRQRQSRHSSLFYRRSWLQLLA